jgi:FixJ family two-component response regulator
MRAPVLEGKRTPPPTIFVIDEDSAVRESLTALVQSVHLDARPFASYEQFLSAYDGAEPGCLLLDAGAHGGHRYRRLEEIASSSALGVIVLIGPGADPLPFGGTPSGGVRILERPCTSRQLRQAVRRVIEEAGKR